ncbi:MAG: prephenate dehydrogenase [Bacteroidetes Order II. Incertae sedis bacterium]|nr:prephenate dehydrogenase [Bacteroidetes Order II. bacterium]
MSRSFFSRISIIGTGLIGASFAKALRERYPYPLHITGYDTPAVVQEAFSLGLIDIPASTLKEAVKDAELVYVAVPIRSILEILSDIAPFLSPGTLVTDAGSVKSPVMQHAQEVLKPENPFIGGHPMAGAEHSGPKHADAFLFENATYVLCPPDKTSTAAFETTFSTLISLISATGARILVLDASRHDHIAATVSHVPQLLAVTLMNLAADKNLQDDAFLKLAAGGFRDMTRIASSAFPMWREILHTNATEIQSVLLEMQLRLATLTDVLQNKELGSIQQAFEQAREVRNTIPKNTKGFLHPLSDVYVFAQDVPGFLYHLTKTIYDAGLNIKDMELLKIREGTGGAFRLAFDNAREADQAVSALTIAGYVAYRL